MVVGRRSTAGDVSGDSNKVAGVWRSQAETEAGSFCEF